MPGEYLDIEPAYFGALMSALVAVLGFLWAVFTGLRSAMSAALLRRAQFYIEFTDRYNSSEMHDAMQNLIAFYDSRPDFAQHYANEFANRTTEGIHLDRHRRTINRYYVNVADMAANGLLDRKMASMLTNFQGLNVYYQIVVPMNRAKYVNNEKNEEVFKVLKGIRKSFNNGSFALNKNGSTHA